MNILTTIPQNHWLTQYGFNNINVQTYSHNTNRTNSHSLYYSLVSEMPSTGLSSFKTNFYSGTFSCMGYPLDVASMLKCKQAYYSSAGANGFRNDVSLDTPYNIAIAIHYYQPSFDLMMKAVKNWDFEIEEVFKINDVLIFTGNTQKWFYTKWKLQALLHIYRSEYCHTPERETDLANGYKYIRPLYELADKYIPNVSLLSLYDVNNLLTIDVDRDIDMGMINLRDITELTQSKYERNSHDFGITQFAKPLLKYINQNPFTKITTGMLLKIRTRHPSHSVLRRKIRTGTKSIVLRLGSTTEVPGVDHEFNTVAAVQNSANKSLMKIKFTENDVRTAIYIHPRNETQLTEWITNNDLNNKKLIIKSLTGSRGRGLYLMENANQALEWFRSHGYGNHIIEKYYNYNREYRLHVSKNGCFYTNRKMLRQDAEQRWYRNDSNCTWILETNPLFNKPNNWDAIVEECVKALNAVGLDIGACDVRVASNSDNFIICEINSAPSFGEITAQKYEAEINRLIQQLA